MGGRGKRTGDTRMMKVREIIWRCISVRFTVDDQNLKGIKSPMWIFSRRL